MYQLENSYESLNKKYNVQQTILIFRSTNSEINNFLEVNENLSSLFEDIERDFIQPLQNNYLIRLVVEHACFEYPVSTNLIRKSDFKLSDFLNFFDDVVQSRKNQPQRDIPANHRMRISLKVVEPVEGRGLKRKAMDMDDFCHNYKGAVRPIINEDNMCLVRAILIGKAIADKEDHWNNLERPRNKQLQKRVDELVQSLQLPVDGPLGLQHVVKIDDFMQQYQITVYSTDRNSPPLYVNSLKGSNKSIKFINLLYYKSHFYTIASMREFYGSVYFCDFCKKKYYHLGKHVCTNTCKFCFRLNCEKVGSSLKCSKCEALCNNLTCFDMHKEQFCFKRKICDTCLTIKRKPHVCLNEKYCNNCRKPVPLEHKCYILTNDQKLALSKNKKKKFNGFIFFDFECYECDKSGEHIVNLAMAQRVCIKCLDTIRCIDCDKQFCFYNIKDFVNWMLIPENSFFIFIAHNSKGYDCYMIINELQKRKITCEPNVEVMVNGTKVIYFKFRDIEIKDSSLFIPMKLDQFSKAFGIKELKKGFFPHSFNKPENQSYIGPYPDKSYYCYDFMTPAKQLEFDMFYELTNEKLFDFQKEFRDYCWSDVQLLTEGCLIFSRLNRNDTKRHDNDLGVCPFREKTTLASFCNFLFTRNFMKENTLALLPAYGFNPKSNMSRECELWLKYVAESEKIYIQHAKNRGEKKIDRFFVDGFCEQNKTIYEFNGCIFHGCNFCYGDCLYNPILRVLNSTLRLRMKKREEIIKNVYPDYKIVSIWGHEWDLLKKKQILDALYGGRTNALKLYHCCTEPNEQIRYIDYTSLYPYVQKYGAY